MAFFTKANKKLGTQNAKQRSKIRAGEKPFW